METYRFSMIEEIHIEQIRSDLTWRIRNEVMYPDKPVEYVKLENDTDGTHFGLFANGYLTSVISLFNASNIYQFRKFATLVPAQGKGYGTKLLEYVITYVKQRGGKKLWCNARLSAIALYTKFGFVKTDQLFTRDGKEFVIMVLEISD